ncbi:MAG TPA: LytTR family DNA-binding domain-containing protein [Gemmatimonadaceae bacterium]|jgi:two-component system LytT family response regulator|nr:LytTR family DNA-binding domain-containing protein [Gemmatimonadaceae bacterium]
MNRIRALIVEDEPLARRALREILAGVPWLECVGEADTGTRAVQMIDALVPDLVLLDIEMPELNGIQVLDRISHEPAVIFTTAYDRYAVSAFELEALDYLLKPFGRERCLAALERARRVMPSDVAPVSSILTPPIAERARSVMAESGPLTRLFVRDRDRIVPVTAAEIERLEAADDYVAVYTRARSYLVYLTLNDFERRLDPGRFIRIHRAHIVNLDYVKQLVPFDGSRMQVEMRDGTKLLASRTRSRELRQLAI